MTHPFRASSAAAAAAGLLLAMAGAAAEAAPLYRITIVPPFAGQANWGETPARYVNDAGVVVGDAYVRVPGRQAPRRTLFRWSAAEGSEALPEGRERSYPATAAGIDAAGRIYGSAKRAADHKAVVWNADDSLQYLSRKSAGADAQALGVNARGDAVGTLRDPETGDRAVLWTVGGRQIDLAEGRPAGAYAHAVNASRQVTGRFGAVQPFFWTPQAGFREMGRLPGSDETGTVWPRDISDAGTVVGSGSTASGGPGRAFLWSAANGYRLIDAPAECATTIAMAINASGSVVGDCYGGSGPFLWTADGGFTYLQSLIDPADPLRAGLVLTEVHDINATGTIVGYGQSDGRWVPLVLTPVE